MNYIGAGGLGEDEWAAIVVDINMHKLKNRVKKARKIIEEHDFITMIEINANDPDEIDSGVCDNLNLPSYELHPFREGYEIVEEYQLRYASFEVTKWSVRYVCSPKHWDARMSLSIEVKT
tara:strand:+ start:312 stop:671 length:360 start_codon:yes stop_codon:yes gene_type:complete